jgi:hypothetical protein
VLKGIPKISENSEWVLKKRGIYADFKRLLKSSPKETEATNFDKSNKKRTSPILSPSLAKKT